MKAAIKNGEIVKEYPTEIINPKICSERTLKQIQEILYKVVHEGLAAPAGSKQFAVSGKTGTAQENKKRPNHALFISYAPYDNPQIAMAVSIPNGYSGSQASELTAKVLNLYFGLE